MIFGITYKTTIFSLVAGIFSIISAQAQTAVGINTATPRTGLVLDVQATNKGVLFPRVSLTDVKSKAPVTDQIPYGLLVYNTNPNTTGGSGPGFYYWGEGPVADQWLKLEEPSDRYWKPGGNSGTNPAIHFVGTRDDKDFYLWQDSVRAAQIGATNTAFGVGSVSSGGNYNSAFGNLAMKVNVTGNYNTAAGAQCMEFLTTGSYNTGAGRQTFYDLKSGMRNTAFGFYSGARITNQSDNTFLGADANGEFVSSSTAIGYDATVVPNLQSSLKYAMAIGAKSLARENNVCVLGGTGNNQVRVGIGLTNPLTDMDIRQNTGTFSTAGIKLTTNNGAHNYRMVVDAAWDFNWYRNGTLRSYLEDGTGNYTVASDRRLKKDISDMPEVLPALMQLNPSYYRYRHTESNAPLVYGLLAQEVEKLFPDFVHTDTETGLKAISYQNFHVVAIQAIKEQQAMIEQRNAKIDDLFRRLEALEASHKP